MPQSKRFAGLRICHFCRRRCIMRDFAGLPHQKRGHVTSVRNAAIIV